MLITLGIIGVVAALTIPGLITKYTERATVSKVKELYSIFQQGYMAAREEYGDVSGWCNISNDSPDYSVCTPIIEERLAQFIKMSPCSKKDKCFSEKYKNRFSNKEYPNTYLYKRAWVLNNGVTFSIYAGNGDRYRSHWCKYSMNDPNSWMLYQGPCAYIYVDINGKSGPNIDGKDLFKFKLYYDGVAPQGRKIEDVWVESFENQCMGKKYSSMGGCTAWVVEKGNMDYLHYDDLKY